MQTNEIRLADPPWQCGDESEFEACPHCAGTGEITHWGPSDVWPDVRVVVALFKCRHCNGTGRRRYWGRDDQCT